MPRLLRLAALLIISSFTFRSIYAAAPVLYTTDGPWLYPVNQITGSFEPGKSCSCNNSIEDLAWRPGNQGGLYGVDNSTPTARMVKLDAATGLHHAFPPFNTSAIGVTEAFASGIAISRLQPNVAIVTGFESAGFPNPPFGNRFVWKVNLDTGSVLGAGVPMAERISSITYSLDGKVLYGTDDGGGRLLTLDPDIGESTVIGDPGLTNFIEGLAFRPGDGALVALDGGSADDIVILNPLDGSLIERVGDLHRGGAHGLAFSIPEPASLFLSVTAFATIATLRNRTHGQQATHCCQRSER